LKPQNILIKAGKFKIIDFGFSTQFDQGDLTDSFLGTPLYMSPQTLYRVNSKIYINPYKICIIYISPQKK